MIPIDAVSSRNIKSLLFFNLISLILSPIFIFLNRIALSFLSLSLKKISDSSFNELTIYSSEEILVNSEIAIDG